MIWDSGSREGQHCVSFVMIWFLTSSVSTDGTWSHLLQTNRAQFEEDSLCLSIDTCLACSISLSTWRPKYRITYLSTLFEKFRSCRFENVMPHVTAMQEHLCSLSSFFLRIWRKLLNNLVTLTLFKNRGLKKWYGFCSTFPFNYFWNENAFRTWKCLTLSRCTPPAFSLLMT